MLLQMVIGTRASTKAPISTEWRSGRLRIGVCFGALSLAGNARHEKLAASPFQQITFQLERSGKDIKNTNTKMTATLPQQVGYALMELIRGVLTGLIPLVLVLIVKRWFSPETSILSVAFSPLYHLQKYHARHEMFTLQGTWSLFSVQEVGFPSRHIEVFLSDGKLYDYQPLDPKQRTIRLLRVTRGRSGIFENKFGAKLVEVSLDSPAFKYLAISYTWGTGQAARRTYALPMGNGQQLCISKQILCIFSTVLNPGRTIHLWIDAICINQANNEEKERQVGLMRDVYKNAHDVVVSLGEPSENINRAMDAIYPLYKAYRSARNVQRVFTPAMSSLQHVGELLCHPYFSRIWVVQEVAAASNTVRIICGDRAVHFSHLVDLLGNLAVFGHEMYLRGFNPKVASSRLISQRPDGFTNAILMAEMRWSFWSAEAPKLSFSEILVAMSHFQSTDPRDKIYALMGFLKKSDEFPFEPSYGPSDKPKDLYRNAASYLLLRDPSLLILHRAGTGFPRSPELQNLPSWAPDWSSAGKDIKVFGYQKRSNFCAGGDPVKAARHSGWGVLIVDGIVIDTIANLSSERPAPPTRGIQTDQHEVNEYRRISAMFLQEVETQMQSLEIEESWEDSDEKSYPPCRPTESLRSAFTKTIITSEPALNNDKSVDDKAIMNMCKRIKGLYMCGDSDSRESIDAATLNYNLAVTAATNRRRFFTTTKGFIGLTSPGTREGDIICLLRGAATPFILRSHHLSRIGSKTWEIVGEAYVHGLMNGEEFCEDRLKKLILV
jgi:hypothetical protein